MKDDNEVNEALEDAKSQLIKQQIDAFNEGYRLGCRAAKQINN